MAVKTGIACVAYYNSATYGTPTWVALSIINDLTQNATAVEAPSLSRANYVETAVSTGFQINWTGNMKSDGSAAWTAIYEAMIERTVLDMLILDGTNATNGATGFRMDCQIFDTTSSQGRGERLYNTIKIMPTESDNPQKAVLVATGAPTYATITGTTLSYS